MATLDAGGTLIGQGSDSPAAVIAALAEATNAHDIDAFVDLFAEDYDSQQPAHPDRALGVIIFGVRAARIAWARLYVEPARSPWTSSSRSRVTCQERMGPRP